MKKLWDRIRRLGEVLMNWGGYFLACVGAIAAPATFIGSIIVFLVDLVGSFFGLFDPAAPVVVPFTLIAGFGVIILGDLIRDGNPERFAFYLTMAWPSLFRAIPNGNDGKLKEKFGGWSNNANDWLDDRLSPWIGETGSAAVATTIAVVCIVTAIIRVERYSRNKNASTLATSGAPAVAAGTPAPTRRARGR